LKQRKIPLRMCINCREMKPKKEMQRLVKAADGSVNIDPTGKMPGRGAYVCKDKECVTTAKKQKRIERAFGVSGCDYLYEALFEIVVESSDKNRAEESSDKNRAEEGGDKSTSVETGEKIMTRETNDKSANG